MARPIHRLASGITARLTLAFVAVAVLAAVANLLVAKTALLVRTTQFAAMPTVPTPASPPVAVEVPKPAPLTAPPSSAVLTTAIDQFEWQSRRRADDASADNLAEYDAGLDHLKVAFSAYQHALDREHALDRTATAGDMTKPFAAYLRSSASLVQAADQARDNRDQYDRSVEAMDRRAGTSLDHAWHLFGRVIARQSLMQLRSDLDNLRKHADDPSTAHALISDLSKQLDRLAPSQGQPWLGDMRVDMESASARLEDTPAMKLAVTAATRELGDRRAALAKVVAAAVKQPARQLQSVTAGVPSPAIPVTMTRAAGLSPALLPHDSMQTAMLTRADPNARSLMAIITVLTLLVTAGIGVLTIRSILVPVRRILDATRLLASGNPESRVTPTGIDELANLAHAFNDMAGRLEASQQESKRHQDSLESQVMERTHKLQQLAEKDPLTSLANRRRLSREITDAIARAHATDGYVGVYFLDIDNFKNYNDSLGHEFGDRVLMSVANRLEEIVDGIGLVSRFGGDEFTIIFETSIPDLVRTFGLSLIQAFDQLLPVDDRELSLSVSVGVSTYPTHAADADSLLRAADSALFRAKELGRSQIVAFTPELAEGAAIRFTTEQGLRRALERGEFELHYQPEVNLETLQLGLVEALLRWRLPDGRLAPPGEFLAVAEQSGLIVEINEWVLRTAVSRAAEWHHGGWPEARVAVNITPRQLLDPRFLDHLLALLEEARLPARCIELELTESVLQTGAGTAAAMHRLKAHGIGAALDDFGTGYSSLTSIEQLPLSRVKLDRSLFINIETSPRSAAIANAVLDLCSGLALEVTVEGIERSQQLAWITAYQNVYVQGYLISEALPGDQILEFAAGLDQRMQDLLLSMHVPARIQPAHADDLPAALTA